MSWRDLIEKARRSSRGAPFNHAIQRMVNERTFCDDTIGTEWSYKRLGTTVMDSSVVIVNNVFTDAAEMLALRSLIFRWGLTTDPSPEEPIPTENTHCLQSGVSRLQQTPHVYHSYNFNRISQLPQSLCGQLTKYFSPLAKFQNAITGNEARVESEACLEPSPSA